MEILGKDGRYELREPIGERAVASVHHAIDLRRRVPVIVKRFAPSAHRTAYAEIVAALKRADIPGVVLPQEIVLSHDPAPFAVYAALPGASLASALGDGAMQWARAAEIVSGCAAILAAVARTTGHTHRALEPGSVWLTPEGGPRILDFGGAALGPSGPVRRGRVLFEYRAPEQIDGSPGDARADVFALAVLLVELTTGIHPFSGTTAFQAAHRLTMTPPDLAELTRGMPPAIAREVAAHVKRSLAGQPDERPPDAAAFAAKLDYHRPLVGAPAPARPAPPIVLQQPIASTRPVEDPSTVMQLPNMRRMFARPPAEPAPPPPEPETLALSLRPSLPPDEAPRAPTRTPVPRDRHEPPLETPEPETREVSLRPAPAAVDRTERVVRVPDEAATQALPRLPRKPADDELATVTLPRGLRLPPASPAETTLLLPDGAARSDATLVLPEPGGRPDVAPTTPPVARTSVLGLLLGLNVLCVLVLVLLVLSLL